MKKITPKTVTAPQKTVRKINFYPIIALLALVAVAYTYYRFGIAATVNGVPITKTAYLRNLERQDKKQTIKQMANEALVLQEAAKKGVVIEQSVIDTEIATVEAQIKAQGETLDTALAAEGMSKEDLVQQIRLQKTVEKLSNPNLDITQAQIDEYLKSNKAALPSSYTKEQLQDLAKTQLISEAKNVAIDKWFTELQKSANIIIR